MEHKSVDFTDEQYQAIEWTERGCSILSLLGSFFVVSSFLFSDFFKAPINRLIFYASLGNILTNVATLVSRSGIKMAEKKGELTALCQFQGLFIQWSVAFCPPLSWLLYIWSFSLTKWLGLCQQMLFGHSAWPAMSS
jgi:hypothetical protein